ncbi:hypothetical protein RRG08_018009 [Elysia crispata]|uniref:Uncharacterized protein n=1 Tax=Elysia crispata TaxID=231223 RepID=A0AAE0ZD27_9GAST|nr:hypothetical protein RRG08_018009 [Elysia crispata]
MNSRCLSEVNPLQMASSILSQLTQSIYGQLNNSKATEGLDTSIDHDSRDCRDRPVVIYLIIGPVDILVVSISVMIWIRSTMNWKGSPTKWLGLACGSQLPKAAQTILKIEFARH